MWRAHLTKVSGGGEFTMADETTCTFALREPADGAGHIWRMLQQPLARLDPACSVAACLPHQVDVCLLNSCMGLVHGVHTRNGSSWTCTAALGVMACLWHVSEVLPQVGHLGVAAHRPEFTRVSLLCSASHWMESWVAADISCQASMHEPAVTTCRRYEALGHISLHSMPRSQQMQGFTCRTGPGLQRAHPR